jgi:hypothetical protein
MLAQLPCNNIFHQVLAKFHQRGPGPTNPLQFKQQGGSKICSQASNFPQKKRETSSVPKLPGNNFLHQSTMHSLNFTNKAQDPLTIAI